MTSNTRRALAVSELLLASSLWGFGFIATVWAFTVFSPFEVTFLRFALAGAFCLFWFPCRREILRQNFSKAFLPAVLLTGTLIFQTWGLQFTTATKSGFITTLYVVLVPILESVLHRKKLKTALWVCVITALVGTALIVNVGIDTVNIGDILTLICAFAATLQIYWLGVISPSVKNPFAFNLMQSVWAAVFCLPVLFLSPTIEKIAAYASWPWQAWVGMLSLTFGSTMIAFFLQVRAQRHLSATVSSLIFLLESPFALIFAILLLGESLGPLETIGAILIFLSAMGACFLPSEEVKTPCSEPVRARS